MEIYNGNDLLDQLVAFNSEIKLSKRISNIENQITTKNKMGIENTITNNNYSKEFLKVALKIKSVASEINVIIHYYGIIMTLPYILDENEFIEEVSLGAGNTGKDFDLTTNKRIAEFKFIHWKGSDTIRQNNTFKDFYYLAEEETEKQKFLYLIDTKHAIKFFKGKRSLKSVLSKNVSLSSNFYEKYTNIYKTISEYYNDNCNKVNIIDLKSIAPDLWKYTSL